MSRDMTLKSRRGLVLAQDSVLRGLSPRQFEIRAGKIRRAGSLLTVTAKTRCWECTAKGLVGTDGRDRHLHMGATFITRDHLNPQCGGKNHKWENQLMVCLECNLSKGTTPWRDWYSDTAAVAAWQVLAPSYQQLFRGVFLGHTI